MIAQYLERIETYFESEYLRNKDSLRAAQEEYYAAFSQGEVVIPPDPKTRPILHYPLMVMIILLIVAGLVTLCMVLLERLFSVF